MITWLYITERWIHIPNRKRNAKKDKEKAGKKREINKNITLFSRKIGVRKSSLSISLPTLLYCKWYLSHFCWLLLLLGCYTIHKIGLVPFHFVMFVFTTSMLSFYFWALLFVLISATILLLLLACVSFLVCVRFGVLGFSYSEYTTFSLAPFKFFFMTMMVWLRVAAALWKAYNGLSAKRTLFFLAFPSLPFLLVFYCKRNEREREEWLNISLFVFIVTIVVSCYFVNTDILMRALYKLCLFLCACLSECAIFFFFEIMICLRL